MVLLQAPTAWAAPSNVTPPTIAGAAQDGQTLTVDNGSWSSPDTLVYSYQWQRCDASGQNCADIQGATAPSYLLSATDVGDQITATVTATDQENQSTPASATQTSAVLPPPAPSSTTPPAISGTAQDGQTLTVDNGSWSSPDTLSYTYQWQRCDASGQNCADIPGATAPSYLLSATDVGDQITATVTAADQENQSAQATAGPYPPGGVVQAVAPVNVSPPSIAGTAQDGNVLAAASGTWWGTQPIAYGYQWWRCDSSGANCAAVTGATGQSYQLGDNDLDATLLVVVSATNSGGSASASSALTLPVIPQPPANTSLPLISGTDQKGQTLTTSTGLWSSPDPLAYSYRWQRCDTTGANCANIAGAIGSSYQLVSADIGAELTVVVTATDLEGQATPASANPVGPVLAPPPPSNTAPPSISGTPQDGQSLLAATGSWTSVDALSYGYQWQRCDNTGANCANVAGATGNSYRLSSADVGAELTVVVTATDLEGQATPAIANPVGPTPPPPPPTNTAPPSISGIAQDGQSLVARSGSWSSIDPLTYSYQWQRCASAGTGCVTVIGAVGQTYSLTSADIGSRIAAVVTATDGSRQASQASTTSVGPVASPPPPANTLAPVISGTLQDGATLLVSNGSWSSPDTLSYTYRWQRCTSTGTSCVTVAGVTGSTYALSTADVGHQLLATVTAADQEHQSRQANSNLSGTVIAPAPPSSTAPPAISGPPQDGQTLTATSGSWSSPDPLTYTFQWRRCDGTGANCTNVTGATGRSYKLTSNDVRHQVTVVATATDKEHQSGQATATPAGPVLAPPPPSNTAPPTISGTTNDGQKLLSSSGVWSSPDALTYSYQWQRCDSTGRNCINITGATTNSYTLTSSDVAHQVTVVATATDKENQRTNATATAVGPIVAPPPPANGALPTISGPAQDGQKLTATTGTWLSPDPLSYTYQWQRCTATGASCASVTAATSATYTLTAADTGSQVTVVVTATDGEHQTGQATAAPVGPVLAPPPPATTTAPSIAGDTDANVGLFVNAGSWSSPDRLTYTYQWQLCDSAGAHCANIPGATSSFYVPPVDDVGSDLTAVVMATDMENQTGQATAAPVGPVGPALTGIHKIQHVVIIMQENRSFDQYFGTFPGADGIPGLAGNPGTVPCVPDPLNGGCDQPFHDINNANYGGPHGATHAVADMDCANFATRTGCKMDGFVNQAEKGLTCTTTNPNCSPCTGTTSTQCLDVMGYHDGGEIPNYWAYARNFVLQDHMYEPNSSWSLPEHLFAVSEWSAVCSDPSNPFSCKNNVSISPTNTGQLPFAWTDLTYLLHGAGISWGYYVFQGTEPDCESDSAMTCTPVTQGPTTPGIWNPLPQFTDVSQDGQLGNIQSLNNFFTAARTGTLPAVSWIVPNGTVSEHPPASVSRGQTYVTGLVNAIMQSPDWYSTAIFVSWDDWGGFYDHVASPAVDVNGFGLRVPGILISPYAKQGYIDHQTLSHDAYVKFIEDDFLGGQRLDPTTDGRPDPRPDVREANPALGDLAQEFDFTQPARAPMLLPVCPATDLAPTPSC